MSKVNETSAQYDKYSKRWKKCRDFCAGQDEVMEAGELYLPRINGQNDAQYTEYLESGYLFNATGRTRQGFVGMVMRKDPDLNVPASLKALTEDMDQEGTTIDELAETLVSEELTVGRGGLLIDHQNVDTKGMSEAEVERMNLRPYAVHYKAEDILFMRTKRVNNLTKIVHLRLRETDEKPAEDEFTTETIERIRVLDLVIEEGATPYYQQRIFAQDKENGEFVRDGDEVTPKIDGQRLDEIPFVFVGGHKFREPWIIDLVNANKQHYQLTAADRRGLRWTTRPQIYVTGAKEGECENLVVGGDSLWEFADPEAEVGMLEYSGTGLSGLEKRTADVKEEMATLGARMIAPEKKMAETAEAHEIKRQGENSALSTVADHVSSAITKVLEWFDIWQGGTGEDISYRLNKDFIPSQMSMADVSEAWKTYLAGGLTLDDVLYIYEQGEITDPSIDRQARKSELQTQRPPGLI